MRLAIPYMLVLVAACGGSKASSTPTFGHPDQVLDFDTDLRAALDSLAAGEPNPEARFVGDSLAMYLSDDELAQLLAIDWARVTPGELLADPVLLRAFAVVAKTYPEASSMPWFIADTSECSGVGVPDGVDHGRQFLQGVIAAGTSGAALASLGSLCGETGAIPWLGQGTCAAFAVLGLAWGVSEAYEAVTGRALSTLLIASSCAQDTGVCGDGICFQESATACPEDCDPGAACRDVTRCYDGRYTASGRRGTCGDTSGGGLSFVITITGGVLSIDADAFFTVGIVTPLEPSTDGRTARFSWSDGLGAYFHGEAKLTREGASLITGRSSQYCHGEETRQLPDFAFDGRRL